MSLGSEAKQLSEAPEIHAAVEKAVRRVCPRWMMDARDDLMQAAMLRVVEIQKKRETEVTFTASYLRRVAYSVVVDEIRRRQRRQETVLEESSESAPISTVGSPEDRARDTELGEGIADCLGKLKAERRQAVVLRLKGYSIAEAASLLGWSNRKTENLIYRGLADLRACLHRKGVRS